MINAVSIDNICIVIKPEVVKFFKSIPEFQYTNISPMNIYCLGDYKHLPVIVLEDSLFNVVFENGVNFELLESFIQTGFSSKSIPDCYQHTQFNFKGLYSFWT